MRRLLGIIQVAFCWSLGICAVLLRPILWPLAKFKSQATLRSLWMGRPIITMANNARAERMLGVAADSLVFATYFTTDCFTHNLSGVMRLPIVRTIVPFLVLVWACVRYTRFHFFCDRGILSPLGHFRFNRAELKLLHKLGKEIFFWTYGADIRTAAQTKALGEPNCCTECPAPGRLCICDDAAGHDNVSLISRHATAVFAMGDMAEYTPGSRNDLFFWPLDLEADGGRKYAPSYPSADGKGPVRIVHAPNHPHFKGTHFLVEAVEQLQREGCPVELELVEGVANTEALRIYRSADIIFDQCLIGFHGYFALEGMALGKAVMCFIRKPREYLLHPKQCPIINTHLDTMKDDIRRLVADRRQLREIGIRGRRYVEQHFSLEAFAERLKRAYRDCGVAG